MSTPSLNVDLKISLLCAEKDRKYLVALESHLELAFGEKDFSAIQVEYLTTATLLQMEYEEIVSEPRAVICLITPAFLAVANQQNEFWEILGSSHVRQRLILMPILAEDCGDYPNPLTTIMDRLWPEQTPMSELAVLGDYPTRLRTIARHVENHLSAFINYQRIETLQWQQAYQLHTTAAYQKFLLAYPCSKYAAQAQERRDGLWEEELWQRAEKREQATDYIHYLRESPLGEYRKEALMRLVEIEKTADMFWQDTCRNTNRSGIVFDYKSRYRGELDEEKVDDILTLLFQDSMRFSEVSNWPKVEAHLLKLQVFKECHPTELFKFSLLEERFKAQIADLDGLFKKLNRKRTDSIVYLAVVVLFLFALYTIAPLLVKGLWLLLLRFPVISLFCLYFVFSFIWSWFRSVINETESCESLIDRLYTEYAELRLAFIRKDELRRMLRLLHNIEEWSRTVKHKRTIDYLIEGAEEIDLETNQLRKLYNPS